MPSLANATMTTPGSRARRGALLMYVLVLAYASLNPLVGWQWPQAFTLFVWPKYVTSFDVLINTAAYVPLGGLLLVSLRRRAMLRTIHHWQWLAWFGAVAGGFCLSVTLELMQSMLPLRVSSPLDLLTNTLGAAIGATGLLLPVGRRTLDAIISWRSRTFSAEPITDWGLLLLAIWFVAQLNPAIPFFEAGLLAAPAVADGTTPIHASAYDPLILLPQVVGVTLNVSAFALFVSLILHRTKRTLPNVGVVLTVGVLAKLSMAALLLKAPLIAASLSPATVMGVMAGLVLFVLFSRISHRWRAFWASVLVFTGGVMAKLSSVYSALDETLRLFNWPYGQLANFASLTRWLNEIWPLAALIFLATIFIRDANHAADMTTQTHRKT